MADPQQLCDDPTDRTPRWAPHPGDTPPTHVALEYLQHLVIQHVMGRGLTAKELSASLGQTEQSWRQKLTGRRRLTLEDLLGLIIAIDHRISSIQPLNPESLRDLFPEAYWGLLTHTTLDAGMPAFQTPDRWRDIAQALDTWWSAEAGAHRDQFITRDVLLHRLLVTADEAGLPASAATAAHHGPHESALDWIADGVHVRIYADNTQRWTGPHGSNSIRSSIAAAAAALWSQPTDTYDEKIVAVAAPVAVRTNLRRALIGERAAEGPADDWHVVGLSEGRRLGFESCAEDLHTQLLFRSTYAQIDWYRVK